MLEEAERAARALADRFTPGEHVAVWAPNRPEWLFLEFGAALAGVVLVTVNPAYRPRELAYVLGQSRSAGIFLVPEFRGSPMAASLDELRPELPHLREVVSLDHWGDFLASGPAAGGLPEVAAAAPAQIQYTSGTTGFPKGVLLHHRGVTNNARFIAKRYGVAPGEVWANPMPLFHVAGCTISALGAVQSLATQVLCQFEPGLVLDLIEREHVAVMLMAPTMLDLLLEHPDFAKRDLSSLRVLSAGGMTVRPALVRHLEATLGVRFSIVFGQTEACGIITQTRLDDSPADRAETVGRALPHTEVKVVDPQTRRAVPPGVVGEICTRGYLVMDGYYEMPEATAEAVDREGWLHTGDLGTMDERGCCRIEGRVKDMIIRGGENIYPREIEAVLASHPAIADVAVVGVPDEKWGEQVAAFIRPASGQVPKEAELHAFVRARLAPFKTPRHWVFVDAFPTTPSGKVQKFLLREQFLRGAAGAKPAAAQGAASG
jgi:fatty-acyl-CoA synthase